MSQLPSRRTLLRFGATGALAGALPALSYQRPARADGPPAGAGPARSCIFLYLAGGPSHIDTFDLKPGRPGGGEFRPVATSVDGLQICEHLPRLAERMKQLALVRSLTAKEGNHDRARHLMHTGYAPAGGADHPAFGSMVAETRRGVASGLPGYVAIAGPGEDSGFLSSAYSPFPVKNPLRPVRHLAPARGIEGPRFARRLTVWRQLEDQFAASRGGGYVGSRRQVAEQALTLMQSSGSRAFQVEEEPESVKEAYGSSEFGAGCLMARRLVEAGVPFVEVTLNGWDTHEDNFNRVKTLCGTLDQGLSALVDDLAGRGLLGSTLLVCAGDFGRTPRINERGGRDHHPACSSVLLGGGGIRPGQVVGESDADGDQVRSRPVTVPDLYRTVAHLLGLNPDRSRTSPAGRPIKTVDGGARIAELLALS